MPAITRIDPDKIRLIIEHTKLPAARKTPRSLGGLAKQQAVRISLANAADESRVFCKLVDDDRPIMIYRHGPLASAPIKLISYNSDVTPFVKKHLPIIPDLRNYRAVV